MKLIAAVSENWGIGYHNQLLYHIPEDMKHFKELTTGHSILMGRNTMNSLNDKPLPNRFNILITQDLYNVPEGFVGIESLKALHQHDDIFCIGGAMVYKACLPFADTIYLTKIFDTKPADTYFPNLDNLPDWELAESSEVKTHNHLQYQFLIYKHRN